VTAAASAQASKFCFHRGIPGIKLSRLVCDAPFRRGAFCSDLLDADDLRATVIFSDEKLLGKCLTAAFTNLFALV
jgi:hypothetical protein